MTPRCGRPKRSITRKAKPRPKRATLRRKERPLVRYIMKAVRLGTVRKFLPNDKKRGINLPESLRPQGPRFVFIDGEPGLSLSGRRLRKAVGDPSVRRISFSSVTSSISKPPVSRQ